MFERAARRGFAKNIIQSYQTTVLIDRFVASVLLGMLPRKVTNLHTGDLNWGNFLASFSELESYGTTRRKSVS